MDVRAGRFGMPALGGATVGVYAAAPETAAQTAAGSNFSSVNCVRFGMMTLVKLCRLLTFALLVVGSAAGQAQPRMPPDAHPAFEVATIRLSDPASTRQGINGDAHGMQLHGQTVTSILMFAYGVHKTQIVEGPAWRSTDKYNIEGVSTVRGEPDLKQMQEMLRGLLADRFGLKVHHDKREMTYYGIEVSKGGPKLVKAADQDATPDQTGNGDKNGMLMKFTANTMPDFALGMQYFLERPVVDETGLSGRWDFTLKWMPDSQTAADANASPGLFTAMQEQLGLKLDAKKGPVDVVVIDALTRPSEN